MKENVLLGPNSITTLNPSNKAFINYEMQDLLFFKNDMLKDIRKLDEKFTFKFAEQNSIDSKKFDEIKKQLNILSQQITQANSKIENNTDFSEKIKDYQRFKLKTEDDINRLNSRIIMIQKEQRDFINKFEKIVNDNLKYPGIIGNNSKFLNFRHFIDYSLRYFEEFVEFREYIKSFGFDEFKRKINSDIQDFRFSISDNYKNSTRLISNNFKEFDEKMNDLIKANIKMIKENENKFDDWSKRINEYLSEYQNKFSTLEKNINDKFVEQLNEMENLKKLKNEFIFDMNNIKSNLEVNINNIEYKNKEIDKIFLMRNNYENQKSFKEINRSNNDNDSNNLINKNISGKNKESEFHLVSRNYNSQAISQGKREHNYIIKQSLFNNDKNKIDFYIHKNSKLTDKYQSSEEKNKTENSLDKRLQICELSNPLERTHNNLELENKFFDDNLKNVNIKRNLSLNVDDIITNKKRLEYIKSDMKMNFEKNDLNNNLEVSKNNSIKNNYSVSNIPNMKIKKVVLPFYIKNKNRIQSARNLQSNNKRVKPVSKNQSYTSKKSFLFNKSEVWKSLYGISKKNKHKDEKNKLMAESARAIKRKRETNINENLDSLMLIKAKGKNNLSTTLDHSRKGKNRSSSFDNGKNTKDEQNQSGFRKSFYTKYKIGELLLMNSKNTKKISKI